MVIDTSDVIDIRIKALQAHRSQIFDPKGDGGANPGAGLRGGRERGVQVRRRVPPVFLQPRKATARSCPLIRSLAPILSGLCRSAFRYNIRITRPSHSPSSLRLHGAAHLRPGHGGSHPAPVRRLPGGSTATIGLVISVFGLARFMTNMPTAILSDRFGRRWILVIGPVIAAVGNTLAGTVDSLAPLLVYRFIAGVGSAAFITGAVIFIGDISTSGNRGRLMSAYQGSFALGITLGPAIGGFAAELFRATRALFPGGRRVRLQRDMGVFQGTGNAASAGG